MRGSYPFSVRALREKGYDPFFAAVLLGALLSASCGARLMKLPSGPAMPAPDAAAALTEATAACLKVSTITAEITVGGSVRGRGLRAKLQAGLASPASARLEAVAPFGQPLFIFVARNNDATLLLPRDGRVLEHGRPEAVLEAIAAVPLDAAALRVVLTGCAGAPDLARARQIGDDWRVVPDGPRELYLHRQARGAPWRACVAGCGLSSDALHPTAPPTDAEGAIRAMREALIRAHLTPAEITYVNAHGTGTVQNDRAEAVALADVFGPGNVLVSSTKSLIGHTMGAAGALEAVATICALETGLLPPTANLWEPDPTIPFDCIPHTARPATLDCAMSNSFGFGGQNVSLIFLRPEVAG